MNIRSFVLGVLLLASIGWCMVQESNRQHQARYKLAELGKQEVELRLKLEKLQAEENRLRSPDRLLALAKDLGLERIAIRTGIRSVAAAGQPAAKSRAAASRSGSLAARVTAGPARRPGEVLDAAYDFAEQDNAPRLAAANAWH